MDLKVFVNGKERTFAGELSVADLLERLQMRPEMVHVQVNGEPVPRGRMSEVSLREGDEVDVVMSMGGGRGNDGLDPTFEM